MCRRSAPAYVSSGASFGIWRWDIPCSLLSGTCRNPLALRFSRRTTNIGVVVVATGVVWFAGYGVGIYRDLANVARWPHVVIAIDVFLLIGCGGALLVNLMTLKQRALLAELAREHQALRSYARPGSRGGDGAPQDSGRPARRDRARSWPARA